MNKHLIKEINKKLDNILCYWKNNHQGYAPSNTSKILNNIEFESVISMALLLTIWNKEDLNVGESIMASVNIGSIVEYMLMFFLIIHLNDYIKGSKHFLKNNEGVSEKVKKLRQKELNPKIRDDDKKKTKKELEALLNRYYESPSNLFFEDLKNFVKNIDVFDEELIDWFTTIQKSRNQIHLHKKATIKTHDEFSEDIKCLYRLIQTIINHLPPHFDSSFNI